MWMGKGKWKVSRAVVQWSNGDVSGTDFTMLKALSAFIHHPLISSSSPYPP
jgi:hypothetical protein